MVVDSCLEDIDSQISKLNERLKSAQTFGGEPIDIPSVFELLVQKNHLLTLRYPQVDYQEGCNLGSLNVASPFTSCLEGSPSLPDIAIHVGEPNQKRLYPLIDNYSSAWQNFGVFFSTDMSDVFHYQDLDSEPHLMVYFLDLGSVSLARVQTDYSSPVISRYDLLELRDIPIDRIREGLLRKFADCKKPSELGADPFYVIEFLKNPDDDSLVRRVAHDIVNQSWLDKNTKPFEYEHLSEYRENDLDWLLVCGPIDIEYSNE